MCQVHPRQDVAVEDPGEPPLSWQGLPEGDRRLQPVAVVELGEDDGGPRDGERAHRVSVVLLGRPPAVEHRHEIPSECQRLFAQRATRLGVRRRCRVSESPDVRVSLVSQGARVDLDEPAGVVRGGQVREPVRSGLRGFDVQHVVRQLLGQLAPALADRDQAIRGIHFGHLGGGPQVDAVLGDLPLELAIDLGDAEDGLIGHEHDHVDVAQHPGLLPVVAREVHRLLGRSGAGCRPRGLNEDHGAAAQRTQERRRLQGEVELVVRRRTRGLHRFGEPRHRVPVVLDSGAHDEVLVGESAAGFEQHGVLFRIDRGDGILHPRHTLRHDRSLFADGHAAGSGAAGDVREERLVQVL